MSTITPAAIASLKYMFIIILTLSILVIWQISIHAELQAKQKSLREQHLSDKMEENDNLESEVFNLKYANDPENLAKHINQRIGPDVLKIFTERYCPKKAENRPVSETVPSQSCKIPELDGIRDKKRRQHIMDSLINRLENENENEKVPLSNKSPEPSKEACQKLFPVESNTSIDTNSNNNNNSKQIEELEEKINKLTMENLEMMQEHTEIEKNMVQKMNDLKTKAEADLKAAKKVPLAIAPKAEKGEDDHLPFCDDLFEKEILSDNKDLRKKIVKKTATKFELENLVNKTGVEHGCWTPRNYCRVRQSVAIVVPFRDRFQQIEAFTFFMHKFLQKQHREYCIILSEQVDKGQFNRAKLMNTGYEFAMNHHPFWNDDQNTPTKYYNDIKPDCFIFHDIDLLPEDPKNLYGCLGYAANHMCDKFTQWNYETQRIPGGVVSSGGIISTSRWQYEAINGHANRYFGWGFEDHEGSVRFRSYNESNDYNVPVNRRRENDFMTKYMDGITDDSGDIGMVRSDKHGYYTTLNHLRGFSNSKSSQKYIEKSGIKVNERPVNMNIFLPLDGLNTNFYNYLGYESKIGYVKASFEIRPFVPKEYKIYVNLNKIYSYELNDQQDQEFNFIDYFSVNKHRYLPDVNQTSNWSEDQISNLMKAKNDLQDNFADAAKTGGEWNGISMYTTKEVIPFPLYTTGPSGNNDLFTVKNARDSFGQFMTLPDINLSEEKQMVNKILKFHILGELLQKPLKFRGLFRIFYEGQLVRSSYQVFDYDTSSSVSFKNSTKFYVTHPSKEHSTFNIEYNMDLLPPGMYLFLIKITDISNQLYLDSYNIGRVKLSSDEKKSFLLTQEFRAYTCSDADKFDEFLKKFCNPDNITLDDTKKGKFLGIQDNKAVKDTYHERDELKKEWSSYLMQKQMSKLKKVVGLN